MTTTTAFVTFGDLVEQTGARREHHVRQALNRLNVRPIRRAGAAYLYPAETVELVRQELQRRGALSDDTDRD